VTAAQTRMFSLAAIACVTMLASPTQAADLCGRPGGTAAQILDRVTKVEKLSEVFRDASYIALSDPANKITWTFTVPGNAAHPSVVCRRIVQDNAGNLNLEMQISCDAAEPACLQLKRDFEALNARMIDAMKQQQKK
jgi:hypothetical protein